MINIIYRVCENETDGNLRNVRPLWFNKINCLRSFLTSVIHAGKHVNKIFFIHDGPIGPLYEYINTLQIKSENIKIDHCDNLQSFLTAVDVADYLIKNLDDHIYFVEDDYLHKVDSIQKLSLAVNRFGLVSGYDHMYRYINVNPPDIEYTLKIAFDAKTNMHWRTSESTTYTWLTRVDIYKRISAEIKKFGIWDIGLFIELHKQGIPLWSSLPGLITHVDQLMSPGINWEEINSLYNEI